MQDSVNDAFFRQMYVHTGAALIATDTTLHIRFWNEAASRLFGRSADAMIGEPVISVVPEDRQGLAQRLLDRALQRGEVSRFEFEHPNESGAPVHLAGTISPIIDDDGGHIGISVHLRDVTRRIDSERALADARKMSALGAMAGAMAHHFNNLLCGLITTADFAQASDDPAVLGRALRSISETLTRARRFTLGLLAFAEGDRRDPETSDVNETVTNFLETLRPSLTAGHIELQTQIQTVDRRLPRKCLLTILDSVTSNAIDSMPQGGTFEVEVSLVPGSYDLLLRFSDNGCGIPAEDLPHVFEPFFTTKIEQLSSEADHTGLGLAIVHGIVTNLGGTVTLCSSPECGTICSVRLPRHGVEPPTC